MARRRMIWPGIWGSEQVNSLSREARLLFIGCFSLADDEGRLHGSGRFIRANMFSYDEDLTAEVVTKWRNQIAAAGLIQIYEADGREYISLPTWHRHQHIDRPSPSVLPAPPLIGGSSASPQTFEDDSSNGRRDFDEDSSLVEGKGGEGSVEEVSVREGRGKTSPSNANTLGDLTSLETETANLVNWGAFTGADRAWLTEVVRDYGEAAPSDIRDCRDHWLAKGKSHSKRQWKARIRNWLRHKSEWAKKQSESDKRTGRRLPTVYDEPPVYDDDGNHSDDASIAETEPVARKYPHVHADDDG